MRIAVDCDLRRIHARTEHGDTICSNAPDLDLLTAFIAREDPTVLFEIASPLDYTDSKAVAYNKRRWTIWNVATAVKLSALTPRLLVAPSHVWTHRHQRDVRHALCKTTARTKDLRECDAMLWFFDKSPADWVPLETYLLGL